MVELSYTVHGFSWMEQNQNEADSSFRIARRTVSWGEVTIAFLPNVIVAMVAGRQSVTFSRGFIVS